MNPETLKQKVETTYKKYRGLKEYNTSIEMVSFKRNPNNYKLYKYLRIIKGIISEYHFQQLMLTNLPQYHFRFNIEGVNNTDIDCWISDLKFGVDVKTSMLYPKPEIMKKNMNKFWYFCNVVPKYPEMTTTKVIGSKSFTYLNIKSDKIWDVDNWEVIENGLYPVKSFQNEFLPDNFIPSDRFIEWLDNRKPQTI
jgi:hypothetical protein